QIEATESFKFHSCFDGFQCSKLKVPLDYFNGTFPKETVSIAVAKLPAKVPVDDPRYGGPIFINPGGPGGSGVWQALNSARDLQLIVDAWPTPSRSADDGGDDDKYFDIIGFDPRGINNTEPAANCGRSTAATWSWALRESTEGNLDNSDAALGRLWAMEHASGASCKLASEASGGFDIKQYMTTASVARDMLQMVEKHDEYNAAVVARLQATQPSSNDPGTWSTRSKPSPSPKLQYLGFSYGTYLGSTFASMYPDRVGRVILDGVVNSDDYDEALGGNELADNEKAMASFYTFCVLAGPEICPLTTLTSTARDIEDRVQSILASLYHTPLQLPSTFGPEILTYSDVRNVIFISLYSPHILFPFVAQLLSALYPPDPNSPVLTYVAAAFQYAHTYDCSATPDSPIFMTSTAQHSILCADIPSLTSSNLTSFQSFYTTQTSISPTSGAIWSLIRLSCTAWPIRPIHRFTSPFGASNTHHPILFMTNTADPVTPLRSAHIMSSRFPGSRVLVQDAAGHCALTNPTPCVVLHVKAYFQSGDLPPRDTLCSFASTSPFFLNSLDAESRFHRSVDELFAVGDDEVEIEELKLNRRDDVVKEEAERVGIEAWSAAGRFSRAAAVSGVGLGRWRAGWRAGRAVEGALGRGF
ncbi:hypothetical protein BU24DRAFT_483091, partial [Aaosphaeria arxii CBS 175.79]